MAENNFINRFTSIYTDKSINGYVRGIAWVGTAVVFYIVGNTIVKAVKGAAALAADKAKQAQIDGDLNKLANQGIQPTYDPSQYASWADAIQAGLSGCSYVPSATLFNILTTSGDKVWNVLDQLKNDADFLNLSKAYGTRTISKSIWCGYFSDVTGGFDATLTRILNQQEISWMNNKLASKGLNSRI
jgi:hypothetical protein